VSGQSCKTLSTTQYKSESARRRVARVDKQQTCRTIRHVSSVFCIAWWSVCLSRALVSQSLSLHQSPARFLLLSPAWCIIKRRRPHANHTLRALDFFYRFLLPKPVIVTQGHLKQKNCTYPKKYLKVLITITFTV